jgi:hypothetical protein
MGGINKEAGERERGGEFVSSFERNSKGTTGFCERQGGEEEGRGRPIWEESAMNGRVFAGW